MKLHHGNWHIFATAPWVTHALCAALYTASFFCELYDAHTLKNFTMGPDAALKCKFLVWRDQLTLIPFYCELFWDCTLNSFLTMNSFLTVHSLLIVKSITNKLYETSPCFLRRLHCKLWVQNYINQVLGSDSGGSFFSFDLLTI